MIHFILHFIELLMEQQGINEGFNDPDQNVPWEQDNTAAVGGWTRARLVKQPNGSWKRVGRLKRINYVI